MNVVVEEPKRQEMPTVDPVTVLIGLLGPATVACTGIASTLVGLLTRDHGVEVGGTVINRTRWHFRPRRGLSEPIHGYWEKTPSLLDTVVPAIVTAAAKEDGPIDWNHVTQVVNDEESVQKGAVDYFSLKGRGMGGESLVVYDLLPENWSQDTLDGSGPHSPICIVLYIKHLPGGKYYAGACLGGSDENHLNLRPGQGKDLAKKMRECGNSESYMRFSSGETQVAELHWDNPEVHVYIHLTAGLCGEFQLLETPD